MDKTRITIVRHGETEWNVTLQLQGHQDSGLTVLGKKQVAATAEIIKGRSFDVLVSSDLRRAVKTAEVINQYHHLELNLHEGLRERNFGIMEGLTRNQVMERYPETHDKYMRRDPDYLVPNGESLVQFYERIVNTIEEIGKQYQGKNILLVAHGGVLDCIIRRVFDMKLDAARKYRLYNGSVNTIVLQNGMWIMEEWGVISREAELKPKDELATTEMGK